MESKFTSGCGTAD